MFKGLSFHTGVEGRAARRLATVAESARRSKQRHLRETARESTLRLNRLRAGQQSLHRPSPRRSRAGVASAAMQASWTATQAEALAEEDAAWSARDPMQPFQPDGTRTDAFSRPFSSASLLHYGAVDAETGNSIVQQSFDALVYRAVLHYGPPLPVEVVLQNNVVSAASMSPAQQRAQFRETQDGGGAGGADDPNAVYMDEVGLRMHEFMTILRKEQPHFSVRDDCDGVPLSLMVRNCSYLRAYGGKVNYMRFVRRLPRGQGGDMGRETTEDTGEEDAASGTMVVSLGRYKMREMPSQDGIRQGPQPWRYSYRTL
ncbi:putative mitochondrial hypothetical protein [Leptomonas pyrrhocoris]|uniref:Uncharacterized protein n=1 Tax=Leptomonas pyrrhocoris TaxID=157538 RepID=A0A0M9FPV5_LEPPY|nr:putative mitochondrial hypothetical protein [Leptomonas pyrrhocoris]XP_015651885.1 putative mitochondrial hypothetical protein [Leptomonas pyrrhocoris]KPA73445.1 putative mitochondrial hypothetical protein [Leptomonas pyrrhocoris]KPA73446.1 putative mitochondrial hypothetical protein [Leptomonas pyrrhocoris]|eukprot:XP_015651884.1 putative mitochondrial hypothetical protein [Leptomonas pyrrhocoris]